MDRPAPRMERPERSESTARLFVGNLHPQVSDQELKDLFSAYGVTKAEVVRGRGGRGRRFGYVELQRASDAERAIREVHGRELHESPLTVAMASQPAPQARSEWDSGGRDDWRGSR